MTSRTILTSDRVLIGGELREASVLIEGGGITAVRPGRSGSVHEQPCGHEARHLDVGRDIIAPGLIDLHVHGSAGYSFDEVTGTTMGHVDPAARILRHLASVGVTAIQASLASDDVPAMAARTRALHAHRRHHYPDEAELLGVHLEGPFLAATQCGAHEPDVLRAPSASEVAELASTAPAMITLAPELPGAREAIRTFVAAGTTVAAGHSEATGDQLATATADGLTHVTHLWSGQSSTTRSGPWRIPGLLEGSLASSGLTAEVIADGKHLPPALLEIARRCLGERLIVVSDATAGTGMPQGFRYALSSVDCEVRDGVGMVRGSDSFGGSTTTLPAMLAHLHLELGWPVAEVLAMGTSRPARIAGVAHRKGALAPGFDADVIVLSEDLRPSRVFVRGEQVPCSRG